MKNRGETAASAKMLSRRFEKKTCSICNTSNALRIGIFNLPLGGREGGEAFARPKLRIYVSRRGEVKLGRNEEKRETSLVMIKLSNATLTAFNRDTYTVAHLARQIVLK